MKAHYLLEIQALQDAIARENPTDHAARFLQLTIDLETARSQIAQLKMDLSEQGLRDLHERLEQLERRLIAHVGAEAWNHQETQEQHPAPRPQPEPDRAPRHPRHTPARPDRRPTAPAPRRPRAAPPPAPQRRAPRKPPRGASESSPPAKAPRPAAE